MMICSVRRALMQVRAADGADVLGAGSGELASRAAQRAQQAAEARGTLVAAWGLAAVSAAHHAGHVLHLMVSAAAAGAALRLFGPEAGGAHAKRGQGAPRRAVTSAPAHQLTLWQSRRPPWRASRPPVARCSPCVGGRSHRVPHRARLTDAAGCARAGARAAAGGAGQPRGQRRAGRGGAAGPWPRVSATRPPARLPSSSQSSASPVTTDLAGVPGREPPAAFFAAVSGNGLNVAPRRRLLSEGFRSLAMGSPNMNSLVAVGCTTSFLVRCPTPPLLACLSLARRLTAACSPPVQFASRLRAPTLAPSRVRWWWWWWPAAGGRGGGALPLGGPGL